MRTVSIADRYHIGMSKQIAIRLPEELVDFIDSAVARGAEPSRAAVVTRALQRERRRMRAQQDVEILTRTEPDADMDAMAAYLAHRPTGLD